ncbi:zinc-ribbon domain-containing protein [Pseudodesulfovibrio senegalensis]|nr:zinc-ribbon domain-containing protein [Pseudodesulfovibrio senegalensis]
MMIVCTRCGNPNDDKARRCKRCGHKLQSSIRPAPGPSAQWEKLEPMRSHITPERRAELMRMFEACAYSLAVVAAVAFSAVSGLWWPLYAVMAVVAVLVVVRRL